jgi:hypothetical protein
MNRQRAEIPEALAQVQQQFEHWRATTPVRAKLPEAFWQAAAEAARQHGLNPTAKALRLDYTALKRRVSGLPGRREQLEAKFVELAAPRTLQNEECVIEFVSLRGYTMRIQWKASAPPDWAKLMRAWRDAEQ